jgi:hypothetical protein
LVKSEIEELCITNRFQNNNIVMKMKRLIPEYKSNNSDFERFDKRVQIYKKVKELKEDNTDKIYNNL